MRETALAAVRSGQSISAVSRATGISRSAVRSWRDGARSSRASGCPRCRPDTRVPGPGSAYAYLLGQYLGDDTLSRGRGNVWSLRIACADAWPGIMAECADVIRAIRPDNTVSQLRRQGCTYVTARWKHWPCLFPQHGPGTGHRKKADDVGRYEYPRWFFTNKSTDILGLCSASLDRIGVAPRFPRLDTISVARREAVATLDRVVGPKH